MKKLTLIVLGLVLSASVASAQTSPYATDVTPIYSIPGVTYNFNLDLSLGSSGQQVTDLQTWLIAHGFDIPSITTGKTGKGYFGQQTKSALMAYQVSVGLPATGFFGPVTRNRMQGISNINPSYYTVPPSTPPQYYVSQPIISGIDSPTTLSVGQVGTWMVRASDPSGGNLTYSVDWGDYYVPTGYAATASSLLYYQSATFTHSYAAPGTYTVRFTVRNNQGYSAQSTVTVYVQGTGGINALRVTSPNLGEIWQAGTVQTISWTAPYYFQAARADIRLTGYQSSASYTIASGISINQNSYSWLVGSVQSGGYYGSSLTSVPQGQYYILVCETGTNNCDSSDVPFTISSNVSSLPDINIVTPNGGEQWQTGTTQQVTINLSGNSSQIGNLVSAYLVDVNNNQILLQQYITLSNPGSLGAKSFPVTIPSTLAAGQYRFLVHLYASNYYGGAPQMQAYDYSNGYLTINRYNQCNGYYCY